jgi:hypothetical protein
MQYEYLAAQRRSHPGWRFLAADHAPMIASFLHATFIAPNVRAIAREQLASQLDDFRFRLHEEAGEVLMPKASGAYLDDWTADGRGWLRKFYPAGAGEAHYDLTPPTEQAIAWLMKLEQPVFIGLEARLSSMFTLLREIGEGTELDPRARVANLKRRRAAIDAEIAEIQSGRLELMEDALVRERFLRMGATARELLSDFRAVDHNLRALDRQVREHIAATAGQKGELLQALFGQHDPIAESDEGRSLRAFWDILMSPGRQDELAALLDKALALPAVRELKPDARLRRIHHELMDAGEATQHAATRLSAQLRRYLDDQSWLENRRIMQLIRDIEQKALAARGQVEERDFLAIDEPSPGLALPMDRTLFAPPFKSRFTGPAGWDDGDDPDGGDGLYAHAGVDPVRLVSNIRRALQTRRQVSLGALTREHPVQHGLAELAAYMKLATHDLRAAIDDEQSETIAWTDELGRPREATVPLIIYAL